MLENKFPGKDITLDDMKDKFPLCIKKNKNDFSKFEIAGVEFGGNQIPIMAGPNMVETKELILDVAKNLNYQGRIFFAGSSEMFGSTEHRADIKYPQNPLSTYAISKQTSFKLVNFYREAYNLNCVTGVLFNHESNLRNENFVTHKIIEGAIKAKSNKE